MLLKKIQRTRYFLPVLLAVAFVPAAVLVYLQYRSLGQAQDHITQMRMASLRQGLLGARVEAETDFHRWPRQALLGLEVHDWLRHRDIARMKGLANGAIRICPHVRLFFGFRKVDADEEVFVFRRSRVQFSMDFSDNDRVEPEIRALLSPFVDRSGHFYQRFITLDGEPHQVFLHLVDDDLTGSKVPHTGKIGYYGFAIPARILAAEYLVPVVNKHLASSVSTTTEQADNTAVGGVFDHRNMLLGSSRPGITAQFGLRENIGNALTGILPGWSVRAGLPADEILRFDRAQFTGGIAVIGVITALLAVSFVLLAITTTREMELSRAKTEFVASVSHELKTPLSLIRGFVETLHLNRISEPSQRDEYFRIIEAEILRLSALIDRILDISKIEVGLKEYDPEPLDVTGLIEDSLLQFSNELERKQFTVDCRIDAPLPLTRVDPHAFSSAMLNLLSNAVKYSDCERQITVTAAERDGKLEVSVADRGIGISSLEQSRIFDSFYRTRQNPRKTGAGLGLALVKHFATAHGGQVIVSSVLGKGSSFAIVLPLHTGHAQ